MGIPAPSTLADLTTRVAALETEVRDHAQKFDTLETPWWKRIAFTIDGWPHHILNAERRDWRPWHK